MPRLDRLDFLFDGPPKAKTLVFIHGWPDGPELWESQVQVLSKSYRCLRVTLPNFRGQKSSEGFDFPKLIQLLSKTIKDSLKDQVSDKIILIGHDWGAYLSYLYEKEFPDQVERLITLDVGARIQADSVKESVVYLSYQGWLISAWLAEKVWPNLAHKMSEALAKIGKAPSPEKTSAKMNYPYFYFWRNLLWGSSAQTLLQGYEPHCPTLFIFGAEKPVMFHSNEWVRYLRERKDCKVVEVPDAGHWIMRDKPQLVTRLIQDWIYQPKASTSSDWLSMR